MRPGFSPPGMGALLAAICALLGHSAPAVERAPKHRAPSWETRRPHSTRTPGVRAFEELKNLHIALGSDPYAAEVLSKLKSDYEQAHRTGPTLERRILRERALWGPHAGDPEIRKLF